MANNKWFPEKIEFDETGEEFFQKVDMSEGDMDLGEVLAEQERLDKINASEEDLDDISAFINEGSLNELKALNEQDVYDVGNMDFDIEDTLGVDWDKEKQASETEPLDDLSKVADKHMISGLMGADLFAQLADTVARSADSKGSMADVRGRNGLIGTVLLDCSRLESADEYRKLSHNSPFKRFVRFAINCSCECSGTETTSEMPSGDVVNPIDSILAATQVADETTRFCKKLNLPVLAKLNDYTTDDAVEVLKELVKLGHLTTNEAKYLLIKASTPLMATKKAFLYVVNQKNREDKEKYSGKVDVNDYILEASKVVNELDKVPSSIEVTDVKEPVVEGVELGENKTVSPVAFKTEEMLVDAGKLKEGELDVDETAAEMLVDTGKRRKGELDVDGAAAIDGDWFSDDKLEFEVIEKNAEPLDVNHEGSFDF